MFDGYFWAEAAQKYPSNRILSYAVPLNRVGYPEKQDCFARMTTFWRFFASLEESGLEAPPTKRYQYYSDKL
jgi:hypothetical protein